MGNRLKHMGNERLIKGFEDDLEDLGRSQRSIATYKCSVRHFLSFLEEKNVMPEDATKHEIRAYIRYLRNLKGVGRYEKDGLADATIKHHLIAVSGLYEYLLEMEKIVFNPVPSVRKRYLKSYKSNPGTSNERQLLTIPQMSMYVNSIMSPRDQAVVVLFAKTGIRRGEFISIDIDDIDFVDYWIKLKPKRKRTNLWFPFDEEVAHVLRRYYQIRKNFKVNTKAFFLNQRKGRLNKNAISEIFKNSAEKVGLHDPTSKRMQDHFTSHCCRHFINTELRRAGMERILRQTLRGDAIGKDAVDLYDHVDKQELKNAYLTCVPKLDLI